jgi:hypothetical protein
MTWFGEPEEGRRKVDGFRGTEFPPPDTDEREVLLSIIGIVNHLSHMEWRGIEGRLDTRDARREAHARVALAAADSAP